MVPKIVEINAMCKEMGRHSYAYCPEIVTSILRNGRRHSRIVVRFYPSLSKPDLFSEMTCGEFTDIVYQRIKELYASVFEDEELSEAELNSQDESIFGLELDSNDTLIGYFYVFLESIVDLLVTQNDRTPIIDVKGQIQGYARYSLQFQVYDQENDNQEIDIMEYDSLDELIGKRIRVQFGILRAENLPAKTSSRTFCQYEFLHQKQIQKPKE